MLAEISGNILKNVKSVVVPNTGGRRGIEAAIAVGIVAGDADAELQVLAKVTEEDIKHIQEYLDATDITVTCPETPCLLDIRLTGWLGGHKAVTRVANNHTNLVYIEKRWPGAAGKARERLCRSQSPGQERPECERHSYLYRNRGHRTDTALHQPAAGVQQCHCRRGTPG